MPAISELWRYPVKSMGGERLDVVRTSDATGVLGDRAYALLDVATGRVASAKHPRNWGALLGYRTRVVGGEGERHPVVEIALPSGDHVRSDAPGVDRVLSAAVGREVRLISAPPAQAKYDEYKPDRDAATGEPLAVGAPEGTFFDFAALHLVTTGTLARLRALAPATRFDVARFRPNLVVDTGDERFHENDWIGHELAIGDEVRAYVVLPCPRCVMTTLAQGDLPADPAVLRTAAEHNKLLFALLAKKLPTVGVYATVVRGGSIRSGDRVRVEGTSTLRRAATFARAIKRAVVRK